MTHFETVVIEPRRGHYVLAQGTQTLLSVPASVFERYEASSVFPPSWAPKQPSHPVRQLFWNPDTLEFLMAGLEQHPARTAEGWGSAPFRSYLQGYWVPAPPVLLLRPFWNPADPEDPFDTAARRHSLEVQQRFLRLIGGLRPPAGWSAILNATAPYLEVLGVNRPGLPAEPGEILEASLTPPGNLSSAAAAQALERLATEQAGRVFPVLREGALTGVHALCLPDLLAAQAVLDQHGLLHQEGPFRPH
ncbi:MAG: hypothetical protein ACNA8S_05635 [Deferrisomatales bacterium]